MMVMPRLAYSGVVCMREKAGVDYHKAGMEETDVPALIGGFRDGNMRATLYISTEGRPSILPVINFSLPFVTRATSRSESEMTIMPCGSRSWSDTSIFID